MNEQEFRQTIISDLLKIEKYRSQKNPNRTSLTENPYEKIPFDDLMRIHSFIIRSLLNYKTFGSYYPSIIEQLKYKTQEIQNCIERNKYEVEQERQRIQLFKFSKNDFEITEDLLMIMSKDYFNAMTDGQLGDYDDYKEQGGNIDDIEIWSRG